MHVWTARCAIIAAAALIATSAQAAKWVQIGSIEYLDTDSVKRDGDLVTYSIFTVVGETRPDATTTGSRYQLNCRTREEESLDIPGQSEIVTKDEPIYRRLCMKK